MPISKNRIIRGLKVIHVLLDKSNKYTCLDFGLEGNSIGELKIQIVDKIKSMSPNEPIPEVDRSLWNRFVDGELYGNFEGIGKEEIGDVIRSNQILIIIRKEK